MRRRRVEIFFVLYLTALVGFVVVSKERDKRDIEIERQKDVFLRSFLKQASISFEGDTLRWYVSSENGSIVSDAYGREFQVDMRVSDIGPQDSIAVRINAVTHNNLLVSPVVVMPVGRKYVGELQDRVVSFPLRCNFTSTGVYDVTVTAFTKRVHFYDKLNYQYRDIIFPKDVISAEVLDRIEETRAQVTIVVEDTSLSNPLDVANIALLSENSIIESATGFQEQNTLTVNLGFYKPSLSIIQGQGTLELLSSDNRIESYLWRGPVGLRPYTVVIEARVDRKAGGKDIARTSFKVQPQLPYLVTPIPEFAFSGETFLVDVNVEGLKDQEKYSWELFESMGNGKLLSKISGAGPKVRYHIPSGFAGRTLIVEAKYKGRPYLQINPVSGQQHESQFAFKVIDPPVHVVEQIPSTIRLTETVRFAAYKYSSTENRFDQPVNSLEDVYVSLTGENGARFTTNVRMVAPGKFEFAVIHDADLKNERLNATLRIQIHEERIEKNVTLMR
jgi:hypothetical protein